MEKDPILKNPEIGYQDDELRSRGISVIVPALNEEENISLLLERINRSLTGKAINFEVIVVDDYSTDNTAGAVLLASRKYPVILKPKLGRKGKAFSLLEGFSVSSYNNICIIDADLQYPPEVIPQMLSLITDSGFDVVVSDRILRNTSPLRNVSSKIFRNLFGRIIHSLDFDVQSGLKVFRKEIIERIKLKPSPWTFDLEFLLKAREAGYKMSAYQIEFKERSHGKSKIGLMSGSLEIGISAVKLKLTPKQRIPFHPRKEKNIGEGFSFDGKDYIPHNKLSISESAFSGVVPRQKLAIFFIAGSLIAGLLNDWLVTLRIFVALLTSLYFSDLIFSFYLIFRSFTKNPEISITNSEINKWGNVWPRYTILCPLYKEWEVLPQFIKAMKDLDYPKKHLQVILLLEEDDLETINHAQSFDLPKYFQIITVPHSYPKTKPKALNFGLKRAIGEYLVIFDAEDIPDPQQLKKSVVAFSKVDEKTVCVQAKLNFYNPHQNILTKIFTAEYSLWFDLILTGLQSLNAPIPLGGTSNHFRTGVLRKIQGWDAFNVTEDCDLGMRIFKRGYQTAVFNSTTYEEANSAAKNWLSQRTRWIKGYIQTYFVHTGYTVSHITGWRGYHWLTFQLLVGVKTLSTLINPVMWLITVSYFILRSQIGGFVDRIYPAPVLYLGVISLIFGNFMYLYYYMIGCAKRKYFDLVKYSFLVPFYWLGISLSSYVAIWNFIKDPFFWSKTQHGLHLITKDSSAADLLSTKPLPGGVTAAYQGTNV